MLESGRQEYRVSDQVQIHLTDAKLWLVGASGLESILADGYTLTLYYDRPASQGRTDPGHHGPITGRPSSSPASPPPCGRNEGEAARPILRLEGSQNKSCPAAIGRGAAFPYRAYPRGGPGKNWGREEA